jgi:hypothetical protein
MVGPLEGADGDPEASTTYVGDVDGGPLGGVVEDPGAPTIDAKKHRQRGPRPLWGSNLHPGSERCVVNLHGYHR